MNNVTKRAYACARQLGLMLALVLVANTAQAVVFDDDTKSQIRYQSMSMFSGDADDDVKAPTKIPLFGLQLSEDNQEVIFAFGNDEDNVGSFFYYKIWIPVDDDEPTLLLGDLNELRNKLRAEVTYQNNHWLSEVGYGTYGVFGGKLTAAHKDYSYFDASDLQSKLSDTELDYSAALYSGIVYENKAMFRATLSHTNSYKGQQAQQFCVAQAIENLFECEDKVIGAPVRNKSTLLSIKASAKINEYFATSLVVTRNFDTDVTGVSIPIYFKQDKNESLSAGIRLNWDSESEDTTASVFFNTPFSL